MDEDLDGATDCDDPDCALEQDCLPTPSLLPATGKKLCFHEDGTQDPDCDDNPQPG